MKRIHKRKTNSFGGFEKLFENKLFENNQPPLQTLNPKKESGHNYTIALFNNVNFNQNLNTPSSINHNRLSIDDSHFEKPENLSSRINYSTNLTKNTQSTNTNKIEFAKVLINSKLSEKEEESSVTTQNTQETVIDKRKLEQSYSNSTPNISNDNNNSDYRIAKETRISYAFGNKSPSELNDSIDVRKSVNERPFYSKSNFNNMNPKLAYNPLIVLKNHLDSVRQVYLTPDKDVLVSIGEDMLINFWDIRKALKITKDNFEPFLTLRYHTSPIFSLTGPSQENSNKPASIFTSGMDGVIRSNKVPSSSFDKNNSVEDISEEIVQTPWRANQDMIWQLEHHYSENLISSVSSDGSVKIFKGYEDVNPEKLCKLNI